MTASCTHRKSQAAAIHLHKVPSCGKRRVPGKRLQGNRWASELWEEGASPTALSQKNLGIFLRDREEPKCSTSWLSGALLPALDCFLTYIEEMSESHLTCV